MSVQYTCEFMYIINVHVNIQTPIMLRHLNKPVSDKPKSNFQRWWVG